MTAIQRYRQECIEKGAEWCYSNALDISQRNEAWYQLEQFVEGDEDAQKRLDATGPFGEVWERLCETVSRQCSFPHTGDEWYAEIDHILED